MGGTYQGLELAAWGTLNLFLGSDSPGDLV